MAELNTLVVPESEILTLRETLYEQQQLLQKLNTDLDVEREASATAASEALSMILRLQGEKASLKMEASQYKRMAEEKICHTEEALAIFEDLIYQREMEIASLEFQVQAYRYRLLSMGCNDLGVYENKFPENLLMQRNETLFAEKGVCNNLKRLNSLPQMQIKYSNTKRGATDRRRSALTAPDSTNSPETSQECSDLDNKPASPICGDINFYWEQIKKLDERVKEISDNKDSCRNRSAIWKGGTWSPSLFSQVSLGTSIDAIKEPNSTADQVQLHQNFPEKDSEVDPACSSVQDIFEVPKTIDSSKAREFYKNEVPNLILEGENRLGKPDVFSEGIIESSVKEKPDQVKTPLIPKRHEKRIPKPRDGKSIDQNVSSIRRTTSLAESQVEYQQLVRRIERIERAGNTTRQEITAAGEGELKLLKEIREQITSIQSEMRSLKTKKPPPPPPPPDEPSLDPLRDAMLYFWC